MTEPDWPSQKLPILLPSSRTLCTYPSIVPGNRGRPASGLVDCSISTVNPSTPPTIWPDTAEMVGLAPFTLTFFNTKSTQNQLLIKFLKVLAGRPLIPLCGITYFCQGQNSRHATPFSGDLPGGRFRLILKIALKY